MNNFSKGWVPIVEQLVVVDTEDEECGEKNYKHKLAARQKRQSVSKIK